ncbi:MAG: hypothetical protein DMG36_06180 [Acidobacteria bacterium]|nr:MAG: hypothetical protein DMG36_06180 [Acidobacteriota bacterium]
MFDHILRFSLDRIFASVDTAFPDSGDVQAPGVRVKNAWKVPAHTGNSPVLSEKMEREVSAPRP